MNKQSPLAVCHHQILPGLLGRLHGLEQPCLPELRLLRADPVKDDERAGPQEDDLTSEVCELVGVVGPRAVTGHVCVIAAVLEVQNIGDVIEFLSLAPCIGVRDCAVVMRPGMVLTSIVS